VAVNYVIQAEVIDIQSDRPRPADALLVDSNVWFWMTYSGAGLGNDWRARVYPNYVRSVRRAKARLYRCGLSVAELSHLIEGAEYDIFRQTHVGENRKEFRGNYPTERAAIITDIQNAWRIIQSMAMPLGIVIDEATTASALGRLPTQLLDGYDLFMAEAAVAAGVTQVLTDDGDYCTVPGIQLFTANRPVLEAARTQGKLITR